MYEEDNIYEKEKGKIFSQKVLQRSTCTTALPLPLRTRLTHPALLFSCLPSQAALSTDWSTPSFPSKLILSTYLFGLDNFSKQRRKLQPLILLFSTFWWERK